jgi:hypothetical protein
MRRRAIAYMPPPTLLEHTYEAMPRLRPAVLDQTSFSLIDYLFS